MPKSDVPLAVVVPAAAQDKPAWVKVGVIAAVGFIVGIAWPRVVGVRLGPSAPGEAAAAAASASASAAAHGGRAPEAPPSQAVSASVVAKTTAAAPTGSSNVASSAAAAGNAVPPNITVQKGTVLSCKTADGETKKGKECGAVPGIDLLVSPRVRKIATCGGVEGQTGKLSLVVNADFASGRFWYDVGKSSSLPNLEAVTSCLKTSFHGTSTTATVHEHPRYTVVYTATFAPGAGAPSDEPTAHNKDKNDKSDKKSDKAKETPDDKDPSPENPKEASPTPAPGNNNSGEAQVAWEVALVRDAPKTGGLVSRLPRGTKVKVGAVKDGWYQIKFGDNFANEGWVYRGAIGR